MQAWLPMFISVVTSAEEVARVSEEAGDPESMTTQVISEWVSTQYVPERAGPAADARRGLIRLRMARAVSCNTGRTTAHRIIRTLVAHRHGDVERAHQGPMAVNQRHCHAAVVHFELLL